LKNFVELLDKLSLTKEPTSIIQLLVAYIDSLNEDEDKDAALKLLLGITPKKVITSRDIKISAAKLTGYPNWLVERSETEAGSFIDALALLIRTGSDSNETAIGGWMKLISGLQHFPETDIHMFITKYLPKASAGERLILLKLLTGTFRPVVSQALVDKAMAGILQITPQIATLRRHELSHKNNFSYQGLREPIENEDKNASTKFPRIRILNAKLATLGDPAHWKAFGKREGIEAQLVKYGNSIVLWTSDHEIRSEKFPEIISHAQVLSGNYRFYGQIIPKKPKTTLHHLTSRLNKKKIVKKEISSFPATFEIWQGDRRNDLLMLPPVPSQFSLLTPINFFNWAELQVLHQNCRKNGYSGILLQQQNELKEYLLSKAEPLAVHAVLTCLEIGGISESGIKSMTFGMLDKGELIPIGKVDAPFEHLDCEEIAAFAKENTLERFGPVRTVGPQLVFELHFDGIAPAPRRKSGFMLNNLSIHKKLPGSLELVDSVEKIICYADFK
jgi:DNA ligase-1